MTKILDDERGTHASHCCKVHGCKYGYLDGQCPVPAGVVETTYPKNNGCEDCEFDGEEMLNSLEWLESLKQVLPEIISFERRAFGKGHQPTVQDASATIDAIIKYQKNKLNTY